MRLFIGCFYSVFAGAALATMGTFFLLLLGLPDVDVEMLLLFGLVGGVLIAAPALLAVWFLRRRRSPAPARPAPPAPAPPASGLEVDILRLARDRGGRVTALEVVTDLGIGVEKVRKALDGLLDRGVAEHLVTDSGAVVYAFQGLEHLDEKDSARTTLS